MVILGIETSCDETACALIQGKKNDKKVKIISANIASSLDLHSKTGGIIPEVASRQQIKYIIPVIEQTLKDASEHSSFLTSHFSSLISRIDAIAVTVGPGLIGSLLVGIETAKTLSFAWNKSIIPVNHLIGHIYANFIRSEPFAISSTPQANIEFPAIVLIVSGGHTDLILMKKHGDIKWLGGTRDDAAGEALDKVGRILNLPYPGGPAIEKAAKKGDPNSFKLPRPMIDSGDFDFSFSGLKTAVFREVSTIKQHALSQAEGLNNETIANLSASVQKAIIDVLITKTLKAAKEHGAKSILLSGGVSANQKLRDEFELKTKSYDLNAGIFFPEKKFCTDNAAMIAASAFFNYKPVHWKQIVVNPELYFD